MKDEIQNLINNNEKLIYKIASKYSKFYPIEDLFQVGVIGLINAYKNFKEDNNTKFTSYAYQYIFGEIINFIKKDRVIKTSKDSLKIYKLYEKSKDILSQKFNRIPLFSEVCEFIELDESIVLNAIRESEFVLSLDSKIKDDEETSFIEYYGVDYRNEIDNLIDLKNMLENLSQEDRQLIELRYYKDYTQSETANILGISQVQVSRYEKNILTKMKKNIVC